VETKKADFEQISATRCRFKDNRVASARNRQYGCAR